MQIHKLKSSDDVFPVNLAQISGAPKQIFYRGENFLNLCTLPCIAVVGSRKVSSYGRIVTEKIVRDLARQGIVIISGLALGVDSIAHQAALSVNGKTIAVLAGGLDRIYPASHTSLAWQILDQGGALISEYPEGAESRKENFIARNRIVSGLSQGLLITEAASKSGSLHTANFALEQGREVMAVPGNITSPLSMGTNSLIKSGATPIVEAQDVLVALGWETTSETKANLIGKNDQESMVLMLMGEGVTDADGLLAGSQLSPAKFNQLMTMLEISGRVKPTGPGGWLLA